MNRRFAPALLAVALGIALGGAARAEDRIGATAIVVNEVARVDKAAGAIGVGDSVFRDETVRTGADSAAKFVFVDDTNLALGASSTVVLDRFVFDDQGSYSKAAVNLAKGAFRFTSGHSAKSAYEIRTGNATIGVRGTILDIRVIGGRSTVTLVEGEARVCATGGNCVELLHPGDTATVTARGATRGGAPFSFAAASGGSCGDLCGQTGFSGVTGQRSGSNGGGGAFPDGALCGR